ncbi:MAG: AI-2E family transporter [Betaproteobacteria bacterium]
MPGADLTGTVPVPSIEGAGIKPAQSLARSPGDPAAAVAKVMEPPASPADAAASASDTPPVILVRSRSRGTLPMVGLFALAVITALYFGRAILMPILFGMILAVVLAPVVERLSRLHIPEPLGAALVMLAALGVLALGIELLVLPAREVLSELPVQVQTLLGHLLDWVRSFRLGNWLTPRNSAELTSQATAQGITLTGIFLKGAPGFVLSVISACLLAFFLLSSGDLFLTKLVRILPTIRDKVRAVKVVRTVQQEVATYFASVTMINTGLGISVTLLTWAFGLPLPWFWGALVALLNFVPYIGAAVSAVLMLLAGMAFTESFSQALLLVASFVSITFVEGQLINPVLVGKRLELNHTIVFVALLFWGWLWGVGGMLLAVPLLIIIKKFADHTPGWEAVAEFLARR